MCEALVAVLRPSTSVPVKAALQPVVAPLFSAVLGRLSAQDQDQEVKECAILCMGAVLGSLGDSLGDEVREEKQCSAVFVFSHNHVFPDVFDLRNVFSSRVSGSAIF